MAERTNSQTKGRAWARFALALILGAMWTTGLQAQENPRKDEYVVSIHSGNRWIGLAPTRLINPEKSGSDSYSVSYALLDRTKETLGAKWIRQAELTPAEADTAQRFIAIQELLQNQKSNDELSKAQLEIEGLEPVDIWQDKRRPTKLSGTAQIKIWREGQVWETLLGTSPAARKNWPEAVQTFMRLLTQPLEEGRAKSRRETKQGEAGLGYTQNADVPMPWHPTWNSHPTNPISWAHWAENLGWDFTEVEPASLKTLPNPTLATMIRYPGFIVDLDLKDLKTMTELGWAGMEWTQAPQVEEVWNWEGEKQNQSEASSEKTETKEKPDIWWGAVSYGGTNYGIFAWELKPTPQSP
jgi:hypothetical protein